MWRHARDERRVAVGRKCGLCVSYGVDHRLCSEWYNRCSDPIELTLHLFVRR